MVKLLNAGVQKPIPGMDVHETLGFYIQPSFTQQPTVRTGGWHLFVSRNFLATTWNPKQPFTNGCFNWMIPNPDIENGCFTKHPFINGCLGFQAWMVVFFWGGWIFTFFSAFAKGGVG